MNVIDRTVIDLRVRRKIAEHEARVLALPKPCILCFDCGKLWPNGYMARDHTWLAAFPDYRGAKRQLVQKYKGSNDSYEMLMQHINLCFKCLETRLNRPLRPEDFDFDIPINESIALGVNMARGLSGEMLEAVRMEANFTGGWMAYTTRGTHYGFPPGTHCEVKFYIQGNGLHGVSARFLQEDIKRNGTWVGLTDVGKAPWGPQRFPKRSLWYWIGIEDTAEARKLYEKNVAMRPY